MAQQCKVCALPERHEIDMGLVQGTITQGEVARRYGVTESSVKRHRANHVPKMLATLATRVQALEADQILNQIIRLYERSLTALDKAESYASDSDQAKAVPALIREARANLEVMAKVSVALNDAASNRPTEVVENTLEAEIREALKKRTEQAAVAATSANVSPGHHSVTEADYTGARALPAPEDTDVAEAEIVAG